MTIELARLPLYPDGRHAEMTRGFIGRDQPANGGADDIIDLAKARRADFFSQRTLRC